MVKRGTTAKAMFESYGYVEVHYVLGDGSEEKITGTWKVSMDAPVFVNYRAKIIEQNQMIEKFVSKLNLEKILAQHSVI